MNQSQSFLELDDRPTLLVIAYLRPTNLTTILNIAYEAGIRSFLISIDAPKRNDIESIQMSDSVYQAAHSFAKGGDVDSEIWRREQNVGCSPAVLSSCDWAFSKRKRLIILEDDCIPTKDFFAFCLDNIGLIQDHPDIWLAGGTQFAPSAISRDSVFVSQYPLTWGWCTTREKWIEMRNALQSLEKKLDSRNSPGLSFYERSYWNAGARRALSGISDAWDTPLVQKMLILQKKTILPRQSLVRNVGNDSVATHTHGNSIGVGISTGIYEKSRIALREDEKVDEWLRENFYKIRVRHYITNKITFLMDKLFSKSHKRVSLLEAWESARFK